MFKKIAIVKIIGGFGNQLFQYSFANKLKQEGFKVFVGNKNLSKSIKEEASELISVDGALIHFN